VSSQNFPYPITTPIERSITESANNDKLWNNGVLYYSGSGQLNPNLPLSSYFPSKWYTVGGFGGAGGVQSNALTKAPWNSQSLAVPTKPGQYINNNASLQCCEYQFFNPPVGQPQFDPQYIYNTQFFGSSVIKPSTGTWRRIKKITVTSNISSSFLVNANTETNFDVYTPGSNPYFVTSGWQAGAPDPATDFFYAPQLIPVVTSINTFGPSYADASIGYYSYQKPGTFVPSAGTYTTSTVGGPGTRVVEITYPENARIEVSDFIGTIKTSRRNTNLISNNAQLTTTYPKVDYWTTRGLDVKISLTNQYMSIPVGSTLNNVSFRIKVEYQQS
jgi:hypothetical protein